MVTLSHLKKYTLEEVYQVAHGEEVRVDPDTVAELDRRRAQIVARVKANPEVPAYGFNRGFGHNVDKPVRAEDLSTLQESLLRSHAAGMGAPVAREVVRATMFLRAASLAFGHSGVRPVLVTTLCELLNRGVVPWVPAFGSVGASGDLAPLSHVGLTLLGDGLAWYAPSGTPLDERLTPPIPAGEALAAAGLAPLRLEMKEGLALNNGVQFSTALGVLSYFQVLRLLKTAALSTAMTAQVMLGADTPFSAALHQLRPHPGAVTVAGWIWAWMEGSPIREAHRAKDIDGEVQDPYNLRCAAQILGACLDLVEEARRTFEIELNSVTDNPVILSSGETYDEIVSGGHFHGMPIAFKLYNLLQTVGVMARLSNMRCVRFVDGARNKGLDDDLKWPLLDELVKNYSSGLMIPEYASASLTNAVWGAMMPSHLFSLSTDAGQEDHVSMSAGVGIRLWQTLPRLAEILAIELAFNTQAAAIRERRGVVPSKIKAPQDASVAAARRELEERLQQALAGDPRFQGRVELKLDYQLDPGERRLSPPCEAVRREVERTFPNVVEDRFMSAQLNTLAERVADGSILAAALEGR